MIVNVFSNGPGNGNAVICTGSATDLVQEAQAPRRNLIKNIGRFIHLHHEGRFSGRKIVRSANPGKEFLPTPNPCRGGGHRGTRMAHQYNERSDEPTSELQTLMRNAYAVVYLKKKT